MQLKMSFFNQLKMFADLIFTSIVCSIMIFVAYKITDAKIIPFLIILYSLIFFFPTVILHLNYFYENKGVVFELRKNLIFKKKEDRILEISTDNIKEITIYTSLVRNTSATGLTHSRYYYVKINLLNGTYLIITSLYSSKIDKIIKENLTNVNIITKKVFYPII